MWRCNNTHTHTHAYSCGMTTTLNFLVRTCCKVVPLCNLVTLRQVRFRCHRVLTSQCGPHQCEKANSLRQTTNRCSREPQKLLLTTPHDVITPPHELTATPDSVRRTTDESISVPTVEIQPQRQNILSYIKTIYLVSSQDSVLVGLCSVPHLNCKIKKKKQEHWARRTVTFNYSNYDTHLLNKYDNL